MAIAVKTLRVDYQSRNGVTGLTDVKGQVFFNGVAKAVGASSLLFSEVDSTNARGLYSLLITAAQLTSWGIAAGQENAIEVYINSATAPLPSPFKARLSIANEDDIAALIGTPAGASIAADILALSTKVGTPTAASVSADIAALAAQQVSLLSQVTALTNAAQSGAGIAAALPNFLTGAAANTYLIPFTILNGDGALVNATGNVVVGLKNQAGTDRGSYLTGSSGTPAVVNATAVSTGQYTVGMVVPASAPEEELIFSFTYTVNGNAVVKYYVCQLTYDAQSSGYALQSTLLSVQTTVNTINSAVGNATYGLSALQTLLANGTYGLSALQSLLANGTYGLSALQGILANGTYGLSALNATLTNATYGLAALQAQNVATQGAGFTTAANSLVAISAAIAAIPTYGGRAV